MKRAILSFLLILSTSPSILEAQMPDSPTGRMAGALAGLLNDSDERAVAAFVEARVAPEARGSIEPLLLELSRACAGAQMRGARRTGATSAEITLVTEALECRLDLQLEDAAPHRLVGLGLDLLPVGRGETSLDLPPADDPGFADALDRQLREWTANDEFSGVVLLARDGEPLFHRAYGMADRLAKRANAVDTQFDIGSITKLLTRVAVAQLLEAGEIDLGDTLLELLPDYPNRETAAKITLQHLLDHASGLGDIFNERWEAADKSRMVAPRDFFPLFADLPLGFEPGSDRSYSNAGFIVLGAIVADVSGKPYASYLSERVFRPAGMERSGFPVRDGSNQSLAIGYTRAEGEDTFSPNLGMLPLRGCPAGSSSHTAADLPAPDRALRGGELLGPEWTAWVYTGQLGRGGDEPDWAIGVAGGAPGVSAVMETDGLTAAIVLSNLDSPVTERLGLELFRAVAGDR